MIGCGEKLIEYLDFVGSDLWSISLLLKNCFVSLSTQAFFDFWWTFKGSFGVFRDVSFWHKSNVLGVELLKLKQEEM